MSVQPLPTFYIPHGGGPCFFMDWSPIGPKDTWDRMAAWLRGLAATVTPAPRAILIVSAHWEERGFCVQSGERPALLFDYQGFPPETYQLTYPAPGAPALAKRIVELLTQAGLPAAADPRREFDHGVFVPLKLVYPAAEIPVLQLSLDRSLDPALHLQAGAALEVLRSEGVLLIGSGMSYHNLREFFGSRGPDASPVSAQFDAWLTEALAADDREDRFARLRDWAEAPAARRAHPREEHLMPLLVAAGAAGAERGERVFTDVVMGHRVSAYRFG